MRTSAARKLHGSFAAAALALAALAALAGCAKRQIYDGDRLPDDKVAYIRAERFLLADVAVEIDGTPVGSLAQYHLPPGVGGGFIGAPRIGASVLPGSHRLAVRVANYGWICAADSACGSLSFTAEANRTYRLAIEGGTLLLVQTPEGNLAARAELQECPVTARR